ncbi:hypothetical protein FHT93_003951 [Rhizobium sp. BK379]|nr:hypothetical protein [Rhizobium sp. BK379]
MKHDAGSSRRSTTTIDADNIVAALAVGRPPPCLLTAGPPGNDIDAIGNHEGGVEPDAELAYQLGLFPAFRGLDPFHEGAGARPRDRAQRIDHLLSAHANAVVLHTQCLLVFIEADEDLQLRAVCAEIGLGNRLVAKFLAGIGSIRDQLA